MYYTGRAGLLGLLNYCTVHVQYVSLPGSGTSKGDEARLEIKLNSTKVVCIFVASDRDLSVNSPRANATGGMRVLGTRH